MIVIPLIKKISELFLIIFSAAVLVRTGVLKSEDSKIISRLSLYLVTPCAIFGAFQNEMTPEIREGLLLTVAMAVFFQALFIVISKVYQKVWHASEVERASVIFTNAGNLIIPIVAYVFGSEWVVYISGYIATFNILCWTYGVTMFDKNSSINVRRIITNPNIIAVLAGFLVVLTGLRLPEFAAIAIEDVGAMVGPISMMITGMVVGGMTIADFTSHKRALQVILVRMVICSGIAVVLAAFSGVSGLVANGHQIVMISLLSAIAPSASNINQLAIVYNHDARYASVINVTTTLSCIVTMPFWMYVFEMLTR